MSKLHGSYDSLILAFCQFVSSSCCCCFRFWVRRTAVPVGGGGRLAVSVVAWTWCPYKAKISKCDTPNENSRLSRNTKSRTSAEERRETHSSWDLQPFWCSWEDSEELGDLCQGLWWLKSPRERRSDAGQGRKQTTRMIVAIKTRLLNNQYDQFPQQSTKFRFPTIGLFKDHPLNQ